MAVVAKNYLDLTGLQAYDALLKGWVDGSNAAPTHSSVIFRTILFDSDNIYFYHKANAQRETEPYDVPDVTVPLAGSDVQKALDEITAIVTSLGGTMASTSPYTVTFPALTTTAKSTLVAAINELDAAIDVLNSADTVPGSVAKSIKDAIEAIDVTEFAIAEKDANDIITIHGVKQNDAAIAVGTTAANDVTLAKVAATGTAADVAVVDAAGKITATDVEGALAELVDAIEDAEDASAVSIYEPTSTSYAHVYEIYQGDDGTHDVTKKIGTINIPKDMVISAAEVKTVTTPDVPYEGAEVGDKYIDITIANATQDHIYVPCKDLVDVYTGGDTAEVSVDITNNEVTATIIKIAATKIDYTQDETVGAALTRLDGADTVTGSVAKKIKDAVESLDTANDVAIATYNSSTDTIALVNGISETDGVIGAGAGDGITIGAISTTNINSLFTT